MELFKLWGKIDVDGTAAAKTINDVDNQAGKAEKSLSRLQKAGQAAMQGLKLAGAAAGGTALAGVAMAESFDVASDRFAASTGKMGQELDDLNAGAKRLYKEGFGEGYGQIFSVLEQTVKGFQDVSSAEQEQLAKQALALEEVSQGVLDYNSSVAAASIAHQNFNISGQQAFDILGTAYQKVGPQADDLLDTVREYSPIFAEAGFSMEQFVGYLVTGLENGWRNTDELAESIQEFMIRIRDGSKSTGEALNAVFGPEGAQKLLADMASGAVSGQQAFQMVLEGLDNMKDPMAQNTAGVALFGTNWEDFGAKATLSLANADQALGNTTGKVNEMAGVMQGNATTAIEKISRSMLGWAQGAIDSNVLPSLGGLVMTLQGLSGLLPGLGGLLGKVGPWFMGMLPGVAAVKSALSVFLGPVGIIMAIIAVLVLLKKAWDGNWGGIQDKTKAVVEWLGKKWEEFGKFTERTWGDIRKFLVDWWPYLLGALGGPVGLLIAFLFKNWDQIKAKTTEAWNGMKSSVVSAASGLVNEAKSKINQLWSWIQSTPSKARQWGGDIIRGLVNGIKSIHIPKPHFDFSISYKTVAGAKLPVPSASVRWYAQGTDWHPGGLAVVGELGPELVNLPPGSQVIPNHELGGAGGIYIENMVVRNDQDIYRIARELYKLQQGRLRGQGI